MKLVDILNGEPGRYMLVEPDCNPDYPAYAKWAEVIVRKKPNGAVKFEDPSYTGYQKGDIVRLNGIIVKSEWVFLGGN